MDTPRDALWCDHCKGFTPADYTYCFETTFSPLGAMVPCSSCNILTYCMPPAAPKEPASEVTPQVPTEGSVQTVNPAELMVPAQATTTNPVQTVNPAELMVPAQATTTNPVQEHPIPQQQDTLPQHTMPQQEGMPEEPPLLDLGLFTPPQEPYTQQPYMQSMPQQQDLFPQQNILPQQNIFPQQSILPQQNILPQQDIFQQPLPFTPGLLTPSPDSLLSQPPILTPTDPFSLSLSTVNPPGAPYGQLPSLTWIPIPPPEPVAPPPQSTRHRYPPGRHWRDNRATPAQIRRQREAGVPENQINYWRDAKTVKPRPGRTAANKRRREEKKRLEEELTKVLEGGEAEG